MSRTRVLFHPFFFLPENWNGMDEHLLLLARHLEPRDFELLVLGHATDGPQTAHLANRAGIRLIPAPYGPWASRRTRLQALHRLYRTEHIDILHIHSPVVGGQTIAALAARLARVAQTIVTYHQIQPARLPRKSRMSNAIAHRLLIDDVIAVSGGVRASMMTETGVPTSRVRVILNGVDPAVPAAALPELSARRPGEVRLAFFGRLSPEKGVAGLLDALAIVARACPAVRTLLVGDGPERAALEESARRLGLMDKVEFLGFRADARQIMGAVDLVVHAPVYEGFGLVVLEAMAAGRPVDANDAPGGLSDIVRHGETGFVVSAGDAAALAQAVVRLAGDADLRSEMGRRGRERYERKFTARGMAQQTSALYRAR